MTNKKIYDFLSLAFLLIAVYGFSFSSNNYFKIISTGILIIYWLISSYNFFKHKTKKETIQVISVTLLIVILVINIIE